MLLCTKTGLEKGVLGAKPICRVEVTTYAQQITRHDGVAHAVLYVILGIGEFERFQLSELLTASWC